MKLEITNEFTNRQFLEENTIQFDAAGEEHPILKFCKNGDIFVRGKLIENDLEIVEGLRYFLNKVNS